MWLSNDKTELKLKPEQMTLRLLENGKHILFFNKHGLFGSHNLLYDVT